VFCLPHSPKASVAVRFCPQLFTVRAPAKPGSAPLTSLPYRMVYAVLTVNAIQIYDTQV
jgi:hypothetical protein